jgi:hypothetical protein
MKYGGCDTTEEQIEIALKKWEKLLAPLSEQIRESEHITEEDLKIRIMPQ